MNEDLGLWAVPIAVLGGMLRVSTPFLFVSLGECVTEKSGRINLGLEGTLVFGAMAGYGGSYLTGNPWAGVLLAGLAGTLFGLLHAALCSLPRVNDIAVGIALMILGSGLAFFFGKPLIQPAAPMLPSLSLGGWSDVPQLRSALEVSPLLLIGIAVAFVLLFVFKRTRIGLILRMVGDSADAARAMGYPIIPVRVAATAFGGFMAGIAGAYLSLYYPGSWNENISSGQGLIAVALVIFARWNPLACLGAALIFGGAGALGPALQSVGVTSGYYLFYAAPYILTLAILFATSSPRRALEGAPRELSITK
ncbi:ABC transporter permease [Aurantimonas sp. 22II-16-19i]|uniref:ABC transporter permease n=1 Tax=Aurantimonas sp. 22II-16-19i TaxID=1317114 RepID=UPI0009F7F6C6|nr:ABC transporter permease [Aurantimonas sp. 22II-16-19i]ORE98160.1 ABC transporter permease [Aurantimonas sp. 22II-16-19i]